MKKVFILKATYKYYDGSKFSPALGAFAKTPTKEQKGAALFEFVHLLGKTFSAHYEFLEMTVLEVPFYN